MLLGAQGWVRSTGPGSAQVDGAGPSGQSGPEGSGAVGQEADPTLNGQARRANRATEAGTAICMSVPGLLGQVTMNSGT